MPGMDRELEALRKSRLHVADIAKLAGVARTPRGGQVRGRVGFCLRVIEQHAALGRELLGPLLEP